MPFTSRSWNARRPDAELAAPPAARHGERLPPPRHGAPALGLARSRDRARQRKHRAVCEPGGGAVFRGQRGCPIRSSPDRYCVAAEPCLCAGRGRPPQRRLDRAIRRAARRTAFCAAFGDDPGRANRGGGGPCRAVAARALDGRQDGPPRDPPERGPLGNRNGGDAGA